MWLDDSWMIVGCVDLFVNWNCRCRCEAGEAPYFSFFYSFGIKFLTRKAHRFYMFWG